MSGFRERWISAIIAPAPPMPLTAGTKLGPYEIRFRLGAGGMGEVYCARDTRLERDVAVKVLPNNLASDPSLRQRLEREAKAASKLSHPHICTLHDIGHEDGIDFLVMEYVEGETLEQRLTKGPLAPEQTLRVAAQIAAALARAHKMGVIHRDIKPANIMLIKTGAKLMDFGLAKQAYPPPLATALDEMTMEKAKLTGKGSLVGTFQYMAPEQLEGKEADARTDIFALGEVIYEMATGKPAFVGNSQASLIAAILTAEPKPMASLQPMTPPALERVVKKCLAKDPEERWQSASDIASELEWIAEGASATGVTKPLSGRLARWPGAGWWLSAALFLVILAGAAAWWKVANKPASPMHFQSAVPFAANDLSLSPDGRMLALIGYSTQMSDYVVWTHELGGRKTTPLEGTQGASYPFWSHDGKSIGFFADGRLKKIDVSDGQVQVLCDAPNGRGGAWGRDGTIVFAPEALGPLYRVSAWGGTPAQLTTLDASRSEASHRWPVLLPDGKHMLYLAANFSGRPGINALFLGSVDSSERQFLVNASANGAYVEPGLLLYMRDHTLVVQPLDQRRKVLTGEPRSLNDEVLYFPQVYRAVFSVAGRQVLVTQNGRGANLSQLTWFDRAGHKVGTVGTPTWHNFMQLSQDRRRVATSQTDRDERNADIWVHDLARGAKTRLTFDPALDMTPVWSPDGRKILFSSNRSLTFRLYTKNSDGSGSEEEIVDSGNVGVQFAVFDWSRDGKYVLLRRGYELGYMAWPDRVLKPLLQTKGTLRGAQFSPDGRWVAYAAAETGRMEVFVSPFLHGNGKWQVSNGGGQEPRWRPDGKELFYLAQDGTMMAAPVATGSTFEAGTPVALFQTNRRQLISSIDVFSYDVSADGKRFLIATQIGEGNAAPPSVLLNWTAELEK